MTAILLRMPWFNTLDLNLALAGVSAGAAVVATLAYRLVSYWLPLRGGLAASAAHRRRIAGNAAT